MKSIDLPNFAEEIRALVGLDENLPPVDQWHPERSGEIDIRIDRDARWYYQGEPMQREAVVKLLSTILRKDNDGFYLVTPAEKMKIQVDDVPFVIRLMDYEGEGREQAIHFSSNVGDHFTLGIDHPLSMKADDEGNSVPYVQVRAGLLAKISRPVYYELAALAVEGDSEGSFGIWSAERFFELA